MRPVTVSVGPLATASATNICASQTPNASTTFVLNGGLVTSFATVTASISGNVMTVTALTAGAIQIGQALNGSQVSVGTTVTGVITGTGGVGTYVVTPAQTVSSTTIYANAVATLDTPRFILFTASANESAKTLTITGVDANGSTTTELLTAPNATTGASVTSWRSISSISLSATAAGTFTVGTTTTAASPWVRLDEYANAQTSIQNAVSGTVNYTVQTSNQDPNSPTNPVQPYQVTWNSSLDTNAVGASANVSSFLAYAPTYVRLLLNSGTGTVTMNVVQMGVVPY
jgi:hypothetical protein